jgi:hypothetical protein
MVPRELANYRPDSTRVNIKNKSFRPQIKKTYMHNLENFPMFAFCNF